MAETALPTELTWTRTPPDAEGHWLRINVVGKPQLHFVHLWSKDDRLYIDWGAYGEGGTLSLPHHKLEGWWWYGPISLPANPETEKEQDDV